MPLCSSLRFPYRPLEPICITVSPDVLYLSEVSKVKYSGGQAVGRPSHPPWYVSFTVAILQNLRAKTGSPPCISSNALAQLPAEIAVLTALRVLGMDNNNLRVVPASVGKLSRLKCLLLRWALIVPRREAEQVVLCVDRFPLHRCTCNIASHTSKSSACQCKVGGVTSGQVPSSSQVLRRAREMSSPSAFRS